MSREPLPTRRPCETFNFTVGERSLPYSATFGFYDDGRVGEVFIDGPKSGTDARTNAKDAAIVLSHALQNGVSLDALRHGISRDDDGKALGPIGTALDLLSGGEGA